MEETHWADSVIFSVGGDANSPAIVLNIDRKMKKVIAALLALVVGMGSAAAQQDRFNIGGLVIDPSGVTAMDMFNYSQHSHTFGTARSAAMAGAMTSLGGDMSVLSINPAGLGMYRTNEATITPMIGVIRSANSASSFEDNSATRFSMSNFGVVCKAYEGTGKIIAVNLGFVYNRLADFNYTTSFYSPGNQSSIANVFARQLQQSGMTSSDFYDSKDYFDWWRIDPKYWGAALGYRCGLVYDRDGEGKQSVWAPDMYGVSPSVNQYTTLESKGSLGEYAFSFGMNINNKIYVGATLGMQSLYQRRELYYGEEYSYASGNAPAGNEVRYFNYNQTSTVDGAGVNLKVGVTYRPIKSLRLGVAVHTPTLYSLDLSYQAAMLSKVVDNQTNRPVSPDPEAMTEIWRDNGPNSWNFASPVRLLLGASYMFGNKAIISVDYERDWYNSIRSKKTPVGKGVYNDFFRQYCKGSNTVRVGAEVKPIPILGIRAGYSFNGSMVKDEMTVFSSPMTYQTHYGTAGVGVSFGYIFVDLAYQYLSERQTDYCLFYSLDQTGELNSQGNIELHDDFSSIFSTRRTRHNVIMTLGFRF